MHEATELLQKRAALNEEVRKIHDAAKSRLLTADELSKVEGLEKDMDNLKANADAAERQKKRDAEEAITHGKKIVGDENPEEARDKKYVESFRNYLVRGERRDLSADTAGEGGNIVAPKQFINELLRQLDNMVWVRQFATKYQLGSYAQLAIPRKSADASDANWTTEIAAVTADSTLAFGQTTLSPVMLSKLIKVSIKLLEVATIPAEQIVLQELAYAFGVTQEKGFITGTGSAQPLGLMYASANGISTGRDYSTGNTTTAIVADNLHGQVYNVKAQYRRTGKWMFHRDAVSMVRKLKDSQNQYLWQPSVQAGQPDTLLGFPVLESEYMPNTFTTGLYVGLFGDLSKYVIVDQIPYTVQRLTELYAGTNQVGFIGRMSSDGKPVDELAFSRVKLG